MKTILKYQKTQIFILLICSLLSISCSSYFVSVDTVRKELTLNDDTLKYLKLTNIESTKNNGRTRIITLKPKQEISAIYKSLKQTVDMNDYLLNKTATWHRHPNYSRKESFYADDAWIKHDTLYTYKNYYSCDTVKIPLNYIQHFKISGEQIKRGKLQRKGIGFLPSYVTDIDGVSLSLITTRDFIQNENTVKINGVNIGLEAQWAVVALMTAQGLVMVPFYLAGELFGKKEKTEQDSTKVIKRSSDTCHRNNYHSSIEDSGTIIINGVNIGILGSAIESNQVNGVNISGLATYSDKLTGFSATGLVTVSKDFEGLCISGLVNHSKRGRGVQIGLINYSKDFKGIQIGLWNKIGKFGFPFINFRFKKKKE
jgi:hypothetical protein